LSFCLFFWLSFPSSQGDPEKAKSVEITLEKPKFDQFRLHVQKNGEISPEKNQASKKHVTTYLPT
jgi:hypothetical protein